MNYQELRNFLKNYKKYPKTQKYSRVPLIHNGFPGTFNLSFTEYDMKKEFNSYSNFTKNMIFSSIQSCIRPQDLVENIGNKKELWKYLGIFEMSDIAGQIILLEKNKTKDLHEFQLKSLLNIYKKLGLDLNKIYPKYHIGGSMNEITKGKYTFDFQIPEDKLSKNLFIKYGIPKQNIIPDKTRDTFLSLHINEKTPWGYRCEIEYNIGTDKNPILLDISTLEYCMWFPTYNGEEKSKNIIGLEPINYSISVGGIGVERLCVCINNYKSIKEIDYIKDFYNEFEKNYPKISKDDLFIAGEVLRTIHRIYSDIEKFQIKKLSYNRRKKIKIFLRLLFQYLKFDEEKIRTLLNKNAKLQPWHEELTKGIEPAIEKIKDYYNIYNKNKN